MKQARTIITGFMRHLLVVTMALLMAGENFAVAAVNPETTSVALQDWMVRIYARDYTTGYIYLMCKGALVSSQLVLTTGACFADPFHALDSAGGENPGFVVKIGSKAELIDVADFKTSPDFLLGLVRLAKPATSKPIAISNATAAQLLNKDVYILSDMKSAAISHDYYNPGTDPHMNCTINGSAFVTDKKNPGSAMCYLLGKTQTSTTAYRINAKVIDPESASAPNGLMDRLDPFDKAGARLYLDFRAGKSYPCNEDLGAPVVVDSGDTAQLVGVVSAVGAANGLPICNQSLINRFSAIAYYKDYLDKATAQSAFGALCPQNPVLQYKYLDDKTALFYWSAMPGATGYKIHITTDVGYSRIQTADLGNKTYNVLSLDTTSDYTVGVSSYNATCSSGVSATFTVWQ